jgi:hypothetical protein
VRVALEPSALERSARVGTPSVKLATLPARADEPQAAEARWATLVVRRAVVRRAVALRPVVSASERRAHSMVSRQV